MIACPAPATRIYSLPLIKRRWVLSLLALAACLIPDQAAALAVEFIADANFPAAATVDGTRFNGLSGIAYDEARDRYYLVSDDRAEHGPARLYLAAIDIGAAVRVTPERAVFLRGPKGQGFPRNTVDFEGIVILASGNLLVSNEGVAARGIGPSLFEFTSDGTYVGQWPVPAAFHLDEGGRHGVRNNLALESLAITPDRKFIFTANEQALAQDGPVATLTSGSPVRIVKYGAHGQPLAQYAYLVDPLPDPTGRQALEGDNGLVELVALSESRLLALERSWLPAIDRTIIRLYRVDLDQAEDVTGLTSLLDAPSPVRFAAKELVLDFDDVVPMLDPDFRSLDNLEGIAFGRSFADGSRTLVVVSDGNFNRRQRTQFIVLKIRP